MSATVSELIRAGTPPYENTRQAGVVRPCHRDSAIIGEIGNGLLVSVCAIKGDTEKDSEWLSREIINLRIFRDDADRMNVRSSMSTVPSHRQPVHARRRDERQPVRLFYGCIAGQGKRLYLDFSAKVSALGVAVANGVFGADMWVELVNDGPVTIWLGTASI
ncbi:D-aminoacyl-tRNA deacylase [Aminobacter aminovorans]|uniref:D-aminoacyl-tRNA deacylase n=1 Tax=Aminobacter TaxID=31988 RepID=UPI0028580408|nr:D-aminoacyl-tRNA deacylase [Aminobacter aminovorans]MDR7223700.1 D-tyrosyl-tRNA(Tyr) deacylase [Aminobacter aminovorans]